MSLGNQTNIFIIVLLGLAAIAFMISGLVSGRKWRRLYKAQRAGHARYVEGADRDLRAARQRITELEREIGSLTEQTGGPIAAPASIADTPEDIPPTIAPSTPMLATETVATPEVEHLPFEPIVDTPVPSAVAPTIDPPGAAIPHLPIATEPGIDSSAGRPIANLEQFLCELPPAPIATITPLRAPDPTPVETLSAPLPVEEERVVDAAPVTADAPPAAEAATASEEPVAASPPMAADADLAMAPADAPRVAPAKSWFGSGRRDSLNRLRGVDGLITNRLFALGVTTYDDIVQLSQEDEMALEQRLGIPAGFIAREQWRAQAGLLRLGREDEFNERFGTLDA